MGSMAPAAAANNTNQNSNDEDYDKESALDRAAAHEGGGAYLKDYLTYEEYIYRRGTFIGKLPEYSHLPNACFIVRNSHVDMIFDNESQHLDVQEVRERELRMEFNPLLPLPTTANTQTIDNFKTCPPIDGSREPDEADEDYDEVAKNGVRDADEVDDDYDGVIEDGRDVPTPGGSYTHSTPITSPVEGTASALDKKLSILRDPTSISDLSDLAMPMLPGRLARSATHVAPPQPPVPTSAVATTEATTCKVTPSKSYAAGAGVSAMTGYGLSSVPVKMTPKRQHTPEAVIQTRAPVARMIAPKPGLEISTNIPDSATIVSQTETTETIPKKRVVDHGVAHPAKTPAVPTTSDLTTKKTNQAAAVSSGNPSATTAPVISTASGATANSNQPSAANAGAPSGTNALTTAQRRLNDIIAGRILPRSKQEAKDAANEQHDRLLAASRSRDQSQSNIRRSERQSILNNPDPDFMPHYFSAANFSAEQREEDGIVRCICGAVENDDEPMLCCEQCRAWQHMDCVWPQLNEAEQEAEAEKNFLCTVCDPYYHRDVLMRLRAGQGVGKQADKVQGKGKGKVKGKAKSKARSKK